MSLFPAIARSFADSNSPFIRGVRILTPIDRKRIQQLINMKIEPHLTAFCQGKYLLKVRTRKIVNY